MFRPIALCHAYVQSYAVSYVLKSIAAPLERPCIELSSSTLLVPLRSQTYPASMLEV